MTGSMLVIVGTVIVVVVIAVVVPGGVFAIPLFILALIAWGAHRYVHGRRASQIPCSR
jgi:hypothetical protein